MDISLDTMFGLPIHPLVVHFVVVLVPLTAIGAVVMALRPSFSRRFGVVIVVIGLLGLLGAVISRMSGETLSSRIGYPEPHATLGDVFPAILAVFTAVLVVFWLFDRGVPGNRARPIWLKVMAALLILVSLFALWWNIRVGHSGAEATWGSVIENTSLGQISRR
jgi:uncharacterized membrane protein